MRIVRSLHRVLPVLCLGADACGAGPGSGGADTGGEFRTAELPQPIPRTDFTFTTTDGEPYDVRAEIEGRLALLVFGFTNGPDLRPVQLANLAAVLDEMGRDTRACAAFRSRRGAARPRRGAQPARRAGRHGDYVVGHPAQIFAFSPDDPARVVYPFGTRVCYEHERRLEAATPAGQGQDARPCRRGCARPAVSRAVRP